MQQVDIKETNLDFTNLSERGATDMIVIHHTGSVQDMDASAAQIHSWHLGQGWAGIGYHFVIRKDGTVERGRPEWAVGSHAYGENSHTIGIHLSGDFNAGVPTEAQVEKCAMLLAYLCDKYGIPVDRNHIVGHGELMSTDCPGSSLQALLDDGTLTGKANWYLTEGASAVEPEPIPDITEDANIRYNTLTEIPNWAQPTIEKLIDKGLLNGNGQNLDLSPDMVREFVVNDRAGNYD